MPPSQPSSIPTKKRRASSASDCIDETASKESIASATLTATKKTKSEPAPDNQQIASDKHKIAPSRLPSKKRKSSHDSTQRSVESGMGSADEKPANLELKENDANEPVKDPNLNREPQAGSNDAKFPLIQPSLPFPGTLSDEITISRSRQNSVESATAALRKHSADNISSPSSSPGRPTGRLRSGSQVSLDDPFSRRKWSQGSLDLFEPQRKGSTDTTHSIKLDVLLDLPPPEPMHTNPRIGEFEIETIRPRSNSTASLVNEGLLAADGGALEHLDALGDDVKPAAKRKDSIDDSSSAEETFASSGHRVLMEAIKLTTGSDSGSNIGSQEVSLQPRERLDSWASRDRFESIGSALEAAAFTGRGRDRLESWGGMSDLSITFGGGGSGGGGSVTDRGVSHAAAAAAAAAAAVAEQFELAGSGEDFAELGFDDHRQRASSIPSRISLGRERFNSIASFSEASFLPDGAEVTIDLNSIVAAAMQHVGDLAELAGIVETVAAADSDGEGKDGDHSETSSVASPMIGAAVEAGNRAERRRRPRSWSASSRVSVDYDTLAAAVDAAQAAAGNFDLSALGIDLNTLGSGRTDDGSSTEERRKDKPSRTWRRQLPIKRDRTESEGSDEISECKSTEEEANSNRKRAPRRSSSTPASKRKSTPRKKQSIPLKKRVKRQNSSPPQPEGTASSNSPTQTPRACNRSIAAADETPDLPMSANDKASSKGQASQKWDSMFDALLAYVEERRQEETANLSEDDKKDWMWDGNVPTTHKTSDGKALGRWVNNQRSAKAKGTLKADREERLVQAGLKWSVLASNSWNETLDELRNYIREQTKDGKKWDGNVPTHYQIKANPNGKFAGEDKNLGRWVNRQRSLYQAGKLRKDRQIALEKLGLKWSMLSSTSWDSMFYTLQEYIEERKSKEGGWDGNVPANFRTNDNPPRALGRWVNRQRSAYIKGKLKTECVDKLNAVGLKWSVHEKNGRHLPDSNAGDDDDDDGDDDEGAETAIAPVADTVKSKQGNGNEDTTEKLTHESGAKTVEEQAAALSEKPPIQALSV